MRYDAVFLDIDGTLLWVDLDIEGYIEDLAPYSGNGGLTTEKVTGPAWRSLRRHIEQNIRHRIEEGLAGFRRRNARCSVSRRRSRFSRRWRDVGSPSTRTPSRRRCCAVCERWGQVSSRSLIGTSSSEIYSRALDGAATSTA